MPLTRHRGDRIALSAWRRTVARAVQCGLLATVLYGSGARAQLHAVPIKDPTALYEMDGYSVLPPPGRNWFEMQRDRQQALFGKRVESRTHSFVATATSGEISGKLETREQLQEYVNRMRTADVDAKRYKLVEFSSEVDSSFPAWCIRYRLKRIDREAAFARNAALMLDDYGVTCLHPDKTDLVVDVGYSERGRAAELSADMRQEGESFVRSLKFTRR